MRDPGATSHDHPDTAHEQTPELVLEKGGRVCLRTGSNYGSPCGSPDNAVSIGRMSSLKVAAADHPKVLMGGFVRPLFWLQHYAGALVR